MDKKDIIYLDNHLLVLNKKGGLLVQGDRSGDSTLLEEAKNYLKVEFKKPGNVFLGPVHRIDRPVSGVVLFARTSKAASRLSEQFRNGTPEKRYLAIVKGKTPDEGRWEDMLARKGATSYITDDGSGKSSSLSFRRLFYGEGCSLVEIKLETGRHHQIRVQFASRGFPILGDFRYGNKESFGNKTIALHAYSLTISHPILNNSMEFKAAPGKEWEQLDGFFRWKDSFLQEKPGSP